MYWGGCGQKWLWSPWSQGKWMNDWMSLADFLHDNTNSRKLKITLIVIGWASSNMGLFF